MYTSYQNTYCTCENVVLALVYLANILYIYVCFVFEVVFTTMYGCTCTCMYMYSMCMYVHVQYVYVCVCAYTLCM